MQTGFIGDEMNPVQITANTRENAEISRKRIPFPLCSTTVPVACGPVGESCNLLFFVDVLLHFVAFCYNSQRFCCLSLPFVAFCRKKVSLCCCGWICSLPNPQRNERSVRTPPERVDDAVL